MMQCPSCGYRIDADAKECPLCGERMKRVSDSAPVKTPEPSAHAQEHHGRCVTEPWPQEKKEKPDYRRQTEEAFRDLTNGVSVEEVGHMTQSEKKELLRDMISGREQAGGGEGKPMVAKGLWLIVSVIFMITAVVSALGAIFNGAYLLSALGRLILANLFFGLSRAPFQPLVPNKPVRKGKFVTASVIAAIVLGLLSDILVSSGGASYIDPNAIVGIVVLVIVGIVLRKMKK